MPPVMMGPPPAAPGATPQPGPFSMGAAAQQQQGPPPGGPGGPGGPNPSSPTQPIEGQLLMVTMQMRHMLTPPDGDPALGPWVNDAISKLQSGVRTIMAQRRQTQGSTMPADSATPSSEPGAGLPF